MARKIFLLRYDTEADSVADMAGFFETAVKVHRREKIPATFFCRGGAIDAREEHFGWFYREVQGDPLFDIQDHSYTHIGVGYESGPTVEAIRADYERSIAAHERVFGVRPIGTSLCGTSGRDGERLSGFDATAQAKEEFETLVGLGMKMVNTFLTGHDTSREFINYASLGHAEVMGFPSGFSDTGWLYQRNHGDPEKYVAGLIEERAAAGEHMPLMLHDWCAWRFGPDRELGHMVRAAQRARELGFELRTHVECLQDKALWGG